MTTRRASFPARMMRGILLWPIRMLWRIATSVCNAIGIVMTLVFALAMLGVGYLFCTTVVGVVVGLPLMLIGFILLLRALY